MFLYLCMCRYGYEKYEQKRSKTDKNEYEIGKRLKDEAGEVKWSKSKLKKETKSTLEFHKVARIVLGESLMKLQHWSLNFQILTKVVL
jgi:hypothetical protein